MTRAYDAVLFDLLTALLDSWTLWNNVAGSDADIAGVPSTSG
jgi:2-haloacid dehalogenase